MCSIPVLDDDKHYWVGDAEVEKLLRHGEGWLREHPERELITNRYLKHQKRLAREALESSHRRRRARSGRSRPNLTRAKKRPSRSQSVWQNSASEQLWQRFAAAARSGFSTLAVVKVGFCENF